jgi:hypothetical protein
MVENNADTQNKYYERNISGSGGTNEKNIFVRHNFIFSVTNDGVYRYMKCY